MFHFDAPLGKTVCSLKQKFCSLFVSCSIYQSVLYVIGSGGPVTPDKVAESKALKINWGRVNGKANTLLWQLGRSGYFHPDIRSKLSFSSPVTFTPPSPNPLHLSFLSFTAETKSSDPTSQLWPRRSAVMSALLMGGSRGKCAEPEPQCKHIKHVAFITTLCQHAKPISWMWVIYYLGMHNISAVRLVSIIWENTITFILPSK